MHASSSGSHALSCAYEPGYCRSRDGISRPCRRVAVKWVTHNWYYMVDTDTIFGSQARHRLRVLLSWTLGEPRQSLIELAQRPQAGSPHRMTAATGNYPETAI